MHTSLYNWPVNEMIKGFNHIGICVRNIDDTLAKMEKTMGAKLLSRTEYPDRHQVSAIVVLPDGCSKFELMEPIGEEGTVAKFLAKKGEGLHHISLLTDDVAETCDVFEEAGCPAISKTTGLAFISPKTTGGVLYELADGKFKKDK